MSGILGYLSICLRISGVLKEFLTDLRGKHRVSERTATGGFFEDFGLKTVKKNRV